MYKKDLTLNNLQGLTCHENLTIFRMMLLSDVVASKKLFGNEK